MRTGCSAAACARATTSRCSRGTASSGRSSTSRSPDRSGRDPGLCVELAAGRRLPARALRGGRRRLRGRRAAREGRGRHGRPPVAPSTSSRITTSTGSRRTEPTSRPRTRPRSTRRPRPSTEDDLYTIIYTSGTTGPPKGCMLSQPQLLRDGDRRRQDGDDVLPARRRHAPLPPARAQLRAVDAPARRARGVHDRVPRRSAPGRRSAAAGAARRCCRASRACTRRCTPPSSRASTPPRG